MIAGIVVDNWKLPIFKRHLDEGKWEYTEHALFRNTSVLKVSCRSSADLQPIVLAAEKECANIHCPTCED